MPCCGHFSDVSFPRVTAFAPQDQAKELVTLRKPTVYKVTSMMTVQIGSAHHLYTVCTFTFPYTVQGPIVMCTESI